MEIKCSPKHNILCFFGGKCYFLEGFQTNLGLSPSRVLSSKVASTLHLLQFSLNMQMIYAMEASDVFKNSEQRVFEEASERWQRAKGAKFETAPCVKINGTINQKNLSIVSEHWIQKTIGSYFWYYKNLSFVSKSRRIFAC